MHVLIHIKILVLYITSLNPASCVQRDSYSMYMGEILEIKDIDMHKGRYVSENWKIVTHVELILAHVICGC